MWTDRLSSLHSWQIHNDCLRPRRDVAARSRSGGRAGHGSAGDRSSVIIAACAAAAATGGRTAAVGGGIGRHFPFVSTPEVGRLDILKRVCSPSNPRCDAILPVCLQ